MCEVTFAHTQTNKAMKILHKLPSAGQLFGLQKPPLMPNATAKIIKLSTSAVNNLLSTRPAETRFAYRLYMSGNSYPEIAQLLFISIDQAKAMIRETRSELKELLISKSI